ncbi:MAG: phage tail tape measure protein [Alkalibacterium sp.]|nr:phage tail tape measure protein [Alkalibacterium sp.]
MGFAREEATGMTGEFMHVAGALANFNSGTHSAEDVTNAMSSAITGQYKSLQGLGIQLDATTVKNKAVEMGLMGADDEMNNQIRTQVLLAEVYNQSGDALDAYTEENLDAKTKMGLLKAEIIDVAAELGTAFLPAINGAIDLFRDMIAWVGDLTEEQQKLIGTIALIAGAIGPLLLAGAFMIDKFLVIKGAVTGVASAISQAGGVMGLFKGIIGALFSPIGLVLGVIGLLAGAFVYLYNNCAYFNDIVGELITAFKGLMDGTSSLSDVLDIAALVLEEFVLSLAALVPHMIRTGIDMIGGFLDGIMQNGPVIIEKAGEIINQLLQGFVSKLPGIIEFGMETIRSLANGLSAVLPYLVEVGITILGSLIDAFLGFLPTLISVGQQFLSSVISGLIAILPELLSSGVNILLSLIQTFRNHLPDFIERGKQLIHALKDGLIAMLPTLIQGGVELMVKLLAKILEYGPRLLVAGIELIWELIKGIASLANEAVGAINEIGAAIIQEAMNVDLMSAGKDIVRGLWNGITSMGGWIGEKVGGFFGGITDKVKGVFGVRSPSRVFRDEIGEMLPKGMVVGVEAEEAATERKIEDSFKGTIGSAAKALQRVKMPDVGARAVGSIPIAQGQSDSSNDSSAFDQMLEYLKIIAAKDNMMVLDDGTIISKNMDRIDNSLADNTNLNKGRWRQR